MRRGECEHTRAVTQGAQPELDVAWPEAAPGVRACVTAIEVLIECRACGVCATYRNDRLTTTDVVAS